MISKERIFLYVKQVSGDVGDSHTRGWAMRLKNNIRT
jgi:hypothetical protein